MPGSAGKLLGGRGIEVHQVGLGRRRGRGRLHGRLGRGLGRRLHGGRSRVNGNGQHSGRDEERQPRQSAQGSHHFGASWAIIPLQSACRAPGRRRRRQVVDAPRNSRPACLRTRPAPIAGPPQRGTFARKPIGYDGRSHVQDLRRHRHRWRPQRPHSRRVPGPRRPEGPRPGAPARPGRRGRDRGGLPRVQIFGLLVRGVALAAGDHPRAGPAPPRPGDPAPGRHLHPHAQRRLPLAHERSRADAARDLPPQPARRRSLRRVLEGHGGHGPLRQAHPLDGAAGSPVLRRAGVLAPLRHGPALPAPAPHRPAQHPPAHDHERGGPARSMVRDGRAQGHHVRERHHRDVPGRALAGHRLRAPAPLHGRDRRRLPFLGLLARRHRAPSRWPSRPRPRRRGSRCARPRPSSASR